MNRIFQILFLVFGGITVLEYCFIRGLFTGVLMVGIVLVLGIINIIYSIYHRRLNDFFLYLLCTVSLCVGYLTLM